MRTGPLFRPAGLGRVEQGCTDRSPRGQCQVSRGRPAAGPASLVPCGAPNLAVGAGGCRKAFTQAGQQGEHRQGRGRALQQETAESRGQAPQLCRYSHKASPFQAPQAAGRKGPFLSSGLPGNACHTAHHPRGCGALQRLISLSCPSSPQPIPAARTAPGPGEKASSAEAGTLHLSRRKKGLTFTS